MHEAQQVTSEQMAQAMQMARMQRDAQLRQLRLNCLQLATGLATPSASVNTPANAANVVEDAEAMFAWLVKEPA